MRDRITADDVSVWLGSDGKNVSYMLELLADIANGSYSPHLLADDIYQFIDENREEYLDA